MKDFNEAVRTLRENIYQVRERLTKDAVDYITNVKGDNFNPVELQWVISNDREVLMYGDTQLVTLYKPDYTVDGTSLYANLTSVTHYGSH